MLTLASLPSLNGEIAVRRRRQTGTFLYEQGGCTQSEADAHGVSLSSYIHALFCFLWQKRSRRVVMIGCGGGTLATLLHRNGVEVTVVDTNRDAFEIAHRYFQMPEGVTCVVADGAEYLGSDTPLYDAVVLDAYDGSRIPDHFRTPSFLRLVKRKLDRTEGVFLANVYLPHDFDLMADRLAEAAASLWNEPKILDARGHSSRNAIVLAGALENIGLPWLMIRPTAEATAIEAELRGLAFRENRLTGACHARRHFRRLAAAQDIHRRE